MRTMERTKEVGIIQPVSQTAIQGGNYRFTSLKNYQHAVVCIRTGVLTGAANAFTMQQAKNVEGNGAKALAFTKIWRNVPTSSPQDEEDLWQEETVTSNSVTLAGGTNYRLEINPDDLDVTNQFDCIRPHFAAPGTSLLLQCSIELHAPRFTGKGKLHQPSARVN